MTVPRNPSAGVVLPEAGLPTPAININQLPRVTFLDGIRGWASVMVLLSHAVSCFLASKYTFLQSPWLIFMTDGNFAVSIFFVLSGIALTINYFRTKDATVLLHLAVRRYPRLLVPIAASTFLGVAFFRLGLFYNHQAAPLLDGQWWLANHFSDARTLPEILHFVGVEVFTQPVFPWGYNINLWTMNIEFMGSFAVIFFCLLVCPLKRAWLVAVPALYAAFSMNFYAPFFLGVVLARFIHPLLEFSAQTRTKERCCLALSYALLASGIVYSTLSRHLPMDKPTIVQTSQLSTLFAGIVIVSVIINKHFRRLLATPLSKRLGLLSFPLYLTHMVVICSFSSFLYLHLRHLDGPVLCLILIPATIIVSLLLAYAFAPVEILAIALSRRLSRLIV
ncbi:MAG: acyltransferase family protein [Acidobacteriota bacterium]